MAEMDVKSATFYVKAGWSARNPHGNCPFFELGVQACKSDASVCRRGTYPPLHARAMETSFLTRNGHIRPPESTFACAGEARWPPAMPEKLVI